MKSLTLGKRERLSSRKQIEQLFSGGHSSSMSAFPLRAVYNIKVRAMQEAPVQMMVSVPKRYFKHAVDRNRVKRQVRESFRQHKQLLSDVVTEGAQLQVAFVWLSDRHMATDEIDRQVLNLMQRMAEKVTALESTDGKR